MTMSKITAKLRRKNQEQYRMLGICILLSVLLVSSFTIMYFSPSIQGFLPPGGDTRKLMWLMLGVVVIGCLIFTLYGSSLFFRKKSREFGVMLALGAQKKDLARQLFEELAAVTVKYIFGGVVLAVPASWLIWKLFRTLVINTAQMRYSIGFTGIFAGLLFAAVLSLCILFLGTRFIRRANIMDILNAGRKTEMVREIRPWCGKLGAALVTAGLFLGIAVPQLTVRLFRQGMPVVWNAVYLLCVAGLYLIILSSVGRTKKGKNPEKYYGNIISTNLMRFTARQTTRNMCVISLLVFVMILSAFWGVMYYYTGVEGGSEAAYDYSLHYPALEDQIGREEIEALAEKYGVEFAGNAQQDGAKTPQEEAGVRQDGVRTLQEEAGVQQDRVRTPQEEAGAQQDETGTQQEEAGVQQDRVRTPQEEAGIRQDSQDSEMPSGYEELFSLELIVRYTGRDMDGQRRYFDVEYEKLSSFISASDFARISGTAVSLKDGEYLTVANTGSKENFWVGFDCLNSIEHPVTGEQMEPEFCGTVESDNLAMTSEPFAFILSDADYEKFSGRLTDEWREKHILFNARHVQTGSKALASDADSDADSGQADGSRDAAGTDTLSGKKCTCGTGRLCPAMYDFADALKREYIAHATSLSNHYKLYDAHEEALALAAGKEYGYTGEIDMSPDNTQLISDWKYAPFSKILMQADAMEFVAVFVLLSLYISIISLTAAGIMSYIRSVTIGMDNRQLFEDLKKLGANDAYEEKVIKVQLRKIFAYPVAAGCMIVGIFSLFLTYFNDMRLETFEARMLLMEVLLMAGIAGILYVVYRLALQKTKQIVGIALEKM